jgi:hypothetical protein
MLPFYERKIIYDIYIKEIKKYFDFITAVEYYSENIFNFDKKQNNMISIIQQGEIGIMLYYFAVFKKAKYLYTNNHKRVAHEMYSVVKNFNIYQYHRQQENQLSIIPMYNEKLIQVY